MPLLIIRCPDSQQGNLWSLRLSWVEPGKVPCQNSRLRIPCQNSRLRLIWPAVMITLCLTVWTHLLILYRFQVMQRLRNYNKMLTLPSRVLQATIRRGGPLPPSIGKRLDLRAQQFTKESVASAPSTIPFNTLLPQGLKEVALKHRQTLRSILNTLELSFLIRVHNTHA